MAYGTVAGVEALLPGMGSAYAAAAVPASPDVEAFLEQGAAFINVRLAAAGWAVPVGSGAALYPALAALNNDYAAAYAVRARGLDTVTGEGERISDVWLARFHEQLNALCASDLSGVGGTTTTTAGRRLRLRSTQLRRVDGYSAAQESATYPNDYPDQ
jgi:hypothetical protein